YQGRGDGSFVRWPDLGLPFAVQELRGSDVDADGATDLVGAGVHGGVLVGRAVGDGAFIFDQLDTDGYIAADAVSVDIDGDGRVDLVASGQDFAGLRVYPGGGDGTFGLPSTVATGGAAGRLIPMDSDDDGDQDIVLVRPDPKSQDLAITVPNIEGS